MINIKGELSKQEKLDGGETNYGWVTFSFIENYNFYWEKKWKNARIYKRNSVHRNAPTKRRGQLSKMSPIE